MVQRGPVSAAATNTACGQEIRVARGNWFYNPDTRAAQRARDAQYEYPQGSACFIQSVKDNMVTPRTWRTAQAMLFMYGSGTGT